MKHGTKGQSLVESTLILTAFMGLLLGMVSFGQMLFAKQTLAQRAHDAARWGAVHKYDPQAIRNLVRYGAATPDKDAQPFLGLSAEAVDVTNPGCPGPDCRVSVAIPNQGIRATAPSEIGDSATSEALSKP